jgi:hypothetical protein
MIIEREGSRTKKKERKKSTWKKSEDKLPKSFSLLLLGRWGKGGPSILVDSP